MRVASDDGDSDEHGAGGLNAREMFACRRGSDTPYYLVGIIGISERNHLQDYYRDDCLGEVASRGNGR